MVEPSFSMGADCIVVNMGDSSGQKEVNQKPKITHNIQHSSTIHQGKSIGRVLDWRMDSRSRVHDGDGRSAPRTASALRNPYPTSP
jgi:hypothetical protein